MCNCSVAVFFSAYTSHKQTPLINRVGMIGSGRAVVFVNLVSIFAAVWAAAVLGQSFEPFHAVAIRLVLSRIALAEKGNNIS